MKKTSNPIIFFGSGPVAAESLAFLTKHFEIEAVITKPQPPHHKEAFPVLEIINKHKLTAYYPTSKDELSSLFSKTRFNSRLGLVVDYGFIINKNVIDYFELGIVNSHFSLLPRWRGADPISFAILNGDSKTGVSLMLIEPTLDTGKLLTQKSLLIAPDETTPSLTDHLVDLSNQLLAGYLPRYLNGGIEPHAQPHPDRATYSRKLTKADGLIDWTKPAQQIEREIRAYIDWPKSRTILAGKEVIVTKAKVESQELRDKRQELRVERKEPGAVLVEDKQLTVQTGDGLLVIEKLKPAGKSEMTAQAFLAGYKV